MKKTIKPKVKKVKSKEDGRIASMVLSWKTDGIVFSRLSNTEKDKAFFKKIKIKPMDAGITSQTGNDIVYYNTKIYASDSDALKRKKIKK